LQPAVTFADGSPDFTAAASPLVLAL